MMGNKFDNNKLWKITRIALNLTMGLLYVLVGYYVIQKNWFMTYLEPKFSYPLGAVLIAYGLFRIYRTYRVAQE